MGKFTWKARGWLTLKRETFTHWRARRVERRRFIHAATPPGCVRTRTFAYFMVGSFVVTVLFGLALLLLYQRTQAVCEPLRFGERAGKATVTKAGKDFARTFGGAADKLGCGGK